MNRAEKVFRDRFERSRIAVFKVAEYLHRVHKFTVTIPAMHLAPDTASMDDYLDDGDILVTDGNNAALTVEVKQKRRDFTCLLDYPFPTMMIANTRHVDRVRAHAYFICNKDLTYAFHIYRATIS